MDGEIDFGDRLLFLNCADGIVDLLGAAHLVRCGLAVLLHGEGLRRRRREEMDAVKNVRDDRLSCEVLDLVDNETRDSSWPKSKGPRSRRQATVVAVRGRSQTAARGQTGAQ